jgi:hypothetical protein
LLSETHYHKEGIIAAAKLLGVKFIEFQHGLISRKDLYYVYRKDIATVAGDALFPDKLLVFGPYWKSLLLEGGEHTESTIACVGDYSYVAPAPQGVEKREVLFIGAQKNMGDVYIPYIEQICSQILPNHAGWELWVKLHPFEKQPERYHALKHLHGLKLFGNESNLHELLASSKIQVSVYSTTFYDALGLDVLNLSIQNYSDQSDYAREMVSELVAFPVEFTDDPIAVYKAGLGGDLLTRDEVYAPFNEKLFESVIRNCF